MSSYLVIKPHSDPFLLSFKNGTINLGPFPPLSHEIPVQDGNVTYKYHLL